MAREPTEAQIQAFGEKLQAWAATLPPQDQAILEALLRLAMGADDEVQGFNAVSPQQILDQQRQALFRTLAATAVSKGQIQGELARFR
jgi:hypothetical protein